MPFDKPLSRPWALAIALVVATASGWIASQLAISDIDQVWYAARALLDGRDPYTAVMADPPFADNNRFGFAFYYPLPAALLVLPLAKFPIEVTRVVMAAGAGGLLAYLVARWRPVLLAPFFLSRAYYLNVHYVQWTTLATCALFLPWLGVVFAAKPNVGAALIPGYQTRRDILIATVSAGTLVVVSMLWQPEWPFGWYRALKAGEHLRPFVLLPGGFLLLLAAWRWKEWRARLLLGLALVPQTTIGYGVLPLLLIPQRWRTAIPLALLSYLPMLLVVRAPFNGWIADAITRNDFTGTTRVTGTLALWTTFLPALVILLLERPRENDHPAHRQ
jgi:hypothetical protein